MKVLPTIILAILLIGYVFAADPACKVFKCGGIDQSGEGPKLCVQFPEGDANNARTRQCDGETNFCQAFTWADPSKATDTAACGTNAPVPTFPNPWTSSQGLALDKDYCEADTDCIHNDDAKKPAKCTENVCVSGYEAGDACKTNQDGPWDMRCVNNVLEARVADGAKCDTTLDCVYGSVCAQKDGATDPTCMRKFSFADGDIFTTPNPDGAKKDGIVRSGINYCKSWSALTLDEATNQWQCRAATRNAKATPEGLAKDTLGAKCTVTAYNNADTAKFAEEATEVDVGDTSKCGFNVDEMAYCPIQFGDEKVNKAILDAANQQLTLQCHPESARSDPPTASV